MMNGAPTERSGKSIRSRKASDRSKGAGGYLGDAINTGKHSDPSNPSGSRRNGSMSSSRPISDSLKKRLASGTLKRIESVQNNKLSLHPNQVSRLPSYMSSSSRKKRNPKSFSPDGSKSAVLG